MNGSGVILLESDEKRLIVLILASLYVLVSVDAERTVGQMLASSDKTVGGSCCGSNSRIRRRDNKKITGSHTSDKNTPVALVLQRYQRAEFDGLGRLIDDDHLEVKLLQL